MADRSNYEMSASRKAAIVIQIVSVVISLIVMIVAYTSGSQTGAIIGLILTGSNLALLGYNIERSPKVKDRK